MEWVLRTYGLIYCGRIIFKQAKAAHFLKFVQFSFFYINVFMAPISILCNTIPSALGIVCPRRRFRFYIQCFWLWVNGHPTKFLKICLCVAQRVLFLSGILFSTTTKTTNWNKMHPASSLCADNLRVNWKQEHFSMLI